MQRLPPRTSQDPEPTRQGSAIRWVPLVALLLAVVATLEGFTMYQLHAVRDDVTVLRKQVATLQARTRVVRKVRSHRPRRVPPQHRWVVITTSNFDYVFRPSSLHVTVGSRVTWVNRTAEQHSITADQTRAFDRSIDGYQRITIVFRKPGRYRYYCRFHPYQRGVIDVTRH